MALSLGPEPTTGSVAPVAAAFPLAFVPLHNHSDYSLLDGASQLPAMVKRAEELGMPALALTDHGVMYGAIELLKLCRGTSVKPIIGKIGRAHV